MKPSARTITIVCGPDGAGKSVYAEALARETDAVLIHNGPMSDAGDQLARIYADELMPAVRGDASVILDRAWPSEKIYGSVFRGGKNRISSGSLYVLEDLARRVPCVIVVCLPPLEHCLESYRARKGVEYLENESQLIDVYHQYEVLTSAIPILRYDYTTKVFPKLPVDPPCVQSTLSIADVFRRLP